LSAFIRRVVIKSAIAAVQNGEYAPCRGRAVTTHSLRRLVILLAPLVFFFVFSHRHNIDAREPAMQVDVGAALRAERPQHRVGGLGADRTFVRRWFRCLRLRHVGNMGNGHSRARACPIPSPLRWPRSGPRRATARILRGSLRSHLRMTGQLAANYHPALIQPKWTG